MRYPWLLYFNKETKHPVTFVTAPSKKLDITMRCKILDITMEHKILDITMGR